MSYVFLVHIADNGFWLALSMDVGIELAKLFLILLSCVNVLIVFM